MTPMEVKVDRMEQQMTAHFRECAATNAQASEQMRNLTEAVQGLRSNNSRAAWGIVAGLFTVCGALLTLVLKGWHP